MRDAIPDEIMKEARDVAGHVYDPDQSPGSHEYVSGLVARALMARDKRAAEKARGFIAVSRAILTYGDDNGSE